MRKLLHFVLPASLMSSVFGLLVFAGFLVFGFQQDILLHPDADVSTIVNDVLPIAQTALTSFSVLCGLTLLVFVEPPNRFWEGGDVARGDIRPTILALVLLVGFAIFLAVPSFSGYFDFAPLRIGEYAVITGLVVVWAFVLRWTWRSQLVERFFSLDLQG